MIFNMTGGGNPLNFKVVDGTTEPSNPKENNIWVNTDKEITGWHFATEQPDDMKEGEVWFSTGTSSQVEFNALKKNGIQVYPISAKQYIGGAWVDKTAKIYQGGEWKHLEDVLFPPVTDWSITSIRYGNTRGTGDFNGDVFTATLPNGSSDKQYSMGISKKINFNELSVVKVYVDAPSNTFVQDNDNGGFLVTVSDTQYYNQGTEQTRKWGSKSEMDNGIVELDVSAVNGTYWLSTGAFAWGKGGTFTIARVVGVR